MCIIGGALVTYIHIMHVLFLLICILMGKKVNKEMGIMRVSVTFGQNLQLIQKRK